MPPQRVTQKEIALTLGVHRSTVSLALSNHPSIPQETRERIRTQAEAMGYKPDPMLSALAAYSKLSRPTKFEGTLAWLHSSEDGFDWRRSNTYRQFHEGAEQRAPKHGYKVESFDINPAKMPPNRISSVLTSRNIQGLLICPLPFHISSMQLQWKNFSAVTFGYSLRNPNLHRISAAHYRSTMAILKRLRQMGYRRIGLYLDAISSQRTESTYLSAFVTDCYLNPTEAFIPPYLYARENLNDSSLIDWIRQHDIDVVMTGDVLTVPFLEQNGFRVPEDIGVACYCLRTTQTPVSGWYEDSVSVGETAVDLLVAMIQRGERDTPANPSFVMVEGCWVSGTTLENKYEKSIPRKRVRQRRTGKAANSGGQQE